MKKIIYEDFQTTVAELLSRNKSILDIMSKFQGSTSRINRAITKAVTSCGCVKIQGSKQDIPHNTTLDSMSDFMDTHLYGTLCSNCRDIIQKEIGNHLFFLAALASTLDISLYDILIEEEKHLATLGKFHLK